MNDPSMNAVEIASLFRLSKSIEAGLRLADFLGDLVNLKGVNAQDLSNAISNILNCQERKDWLGLADYLEFELVHIIGDSVSSAA